MSAIPETESPAFENIGSDSLAQLERASIDMQISTAKRYPRDFGKVKKSMLSLATLDSDTAATCFYKLSRSGQAIEGPSVRMAEIAVSCFGNIRAASRIIDNNGKVITAQGVCHDLENNTLISVEVKRRITDKNGKTYSEDMQVMTGNAACSIAFRNAVYKVVPLALIKPVYEEAKRCAVGDIKTLAERRTNALKFFANLGVNKEQVLAYLAKHSVESIDLSDVETLIGLSTAIKDGNTTVEEAFGMNGNGNGHGKTAKVSAPPSKLSHGDENAGEAARGGGSPATPVEEKASLRDGLRNLCTASHVTENQVVDYMISQGVAAEDAKTFEDCLDDKLQLVRDDWERYLPIIQAAAQPLEPKANGDVECPLKVLMAGDGITEDQFLKWMKASEAQSAAALQRYSAA
jgi:hypothetical protein